MKSVILVYSGSFPPTTAVSQVAEVTADLHARSAVPKHVESMIRSFPKDMHAMSMFSAALFAMQVSLGFPHDVQFVSYREFTFVETNDGCAPVCLEDRCVSFVIYSITPRPLFRNIV